MSTAIAIGQPRTNDVAQAAQDYALRGWPVFPCHSIQDGHCTCGKECDSPGKHPRTKNGLKDATTDSYTIADWWRKYPNANVAIVTGRESDLVVLDIDPRHGGNESLEALEAEHGSLPPTVEAVTGGDGSHPLLKHPGVEIRNRTNFRQGIDVRGDGGYIIVSPSNHISGGHYRWDEGRGPGEIELAELPGWLLELLTADKAERHDANGTVSDDGLLKRATSYVAKADAAVEGCRNDAAFRLAGNVAALAGPLGERLTENHVVDLLRVWNLRNNPPLEDDELRQCVASALINGTPRQDKPTSGRVSAGCGLREGETAKREGVIANYELKQIANAATGKEETITVPISMTDIIETVNRNTDGWPRRVDNVLFVDDPQYGIDWFDRRTTAGLFGWLRRHLEVEWKRGGKLVSQSELFAELERTAEKYDAIENYPHEPPIVRHYYRCKPPKLGDGSALHFLLDRFRPETSIDRGLIQAAMMTVFWGGPVSCRPAFVITADAGRGVGKTKLAEIIAYLVGGFIDVSAGEDIATLKQRFLSPEGQARRVALLDNVKSLSFSWAELESLITTPTISGKRMYVGEGQRPNTITWLMTLNGVSLATDLAQRSVIIKLVKGKNDGTWYEDTIRFIDENRKAIIGDIIAALRADRFEPAEYTRWAAWERDVLSRLPEPGEAQRVILERQTEANCEQDEAEIIEEHFAEQLRRLGYDIERAQVRIPVAVAAGWYGGAVGGKTARTAAASKRLRQMSDESQLHRIAPDPSRKHGRCFVWTGERCDINETVANDLMSRLASKDDAK